MTTRLNNTVTVMRGDRKIVEFCEYVDDESEKPRTYWEWNSVDVDGNGVRTHHDGAVNDLPTLIGLAAMVKFEGAGR